MKKEVVEAIAHRQFKEDYGDRLGRPQIVASEEDSSAMLYQWDVIVMYD